MHLRSGNNFRYALDSRKARRELHWEPQTDFKTGLQQTLLWYRENQAWVEAIKGDSYQRYYSRMYENRKGYLRNL